jgi:hypothetical protein
MLPLKQHLGHEINLTTRLRPPVFIQITERDPKLRSSRAIARNTGFSPLLDGDGVASDVNIVSRRGHSGVSVPFSMGTVLHPAGPVTNGYLSGGFSPLLDGDGVASYHCKSVIRYWCLFQSPSRSEPCCIGRAMARTPRE